MPDRILIAGVPFEEYMGSKREQGMVGSYDLGLSPEIRSFEASWRQETRIGPFSGMCLVYRSCSYLLLICTSLSIPS